MFKLRYSTVAAVFIIVFVLLILLAGYVAVLPAAAAPQARQTLTVGSGCAYTTVQAAVDAAATGDTIHIAAETFNLAAAHVQVVDKSLTFIGGYQNDCLLLTAVPSVTTLDAVGWAGSVITFSGATVSHTVALHNMVLRGGVADSGGGINIGSQYAVALHNVTVRDNTAVRFGGGINIEADAGEEAATSLSLFDAKIITNTSENVGGGIFSRNAALFMQGDSAVGQAGVGNYAENSGGGISMTGIGSQIVASGLGEVSHNVSGRFGGGGISVSVGGQLIISAGFTIQGNAAYGGGGGGIRASEVGTTISLTDSAVLSNTAEWSGGGIYLANDATAILGGTTQVSGNAAGIDNASSDGGGIFLFAATLTLTQQAVLAHNVTGNEGGGVYASSDSVFLMRESAAVQHNSASGDGGGVYVKSSAEFSMQGVGEARPSLQHNDAVSNGGGFYSWDKVSIMNADIYSNTALSRGGGGHVRRGVVEFVNTVFEGNTASKGGGLYLEGGIVGEISAEFDTCTSDALPVGRYCSQFHQNQADEGAAIVVSGAILTATHTAVTENVGDSILHIKGNSSEVTMDTLLIRDNATAAGGRVVEGSVSLRNSAQVAIVNSTLYRNAHAPIWTLDHGITLAVERSIMWGNASGAYIDPEVFFSSACNSVQPVGAGSQEFAAADGNSGNDPQLENGGYLMFGSPAIDACAGGSAVDLNGALRPMDGDGAASGNEYDRGVFEFDSQDIPTAVGLVTGQVAGSAETRLHFFVLLMLLLTLLLSPQARRSLFKLNLTQR